MDIKELKKDEYKIFYKLFKGFELAPFFEKWTDEEIEKTFEEFMQDGLVFGLKDKGIITILPEKRKSSILPYSEWGKFCYISDVMVDENSRRQGIGGSLLKFALDYMKKDGWDTSYFRTNYKGSLLEPVATKQGFKDVKDKQGNVITEEVGFLRQSGKVETDTRKYLVKELKRKC